MKPTFSTLLVILLFKWSGAQELPLDKLDEAIAVYTSKVEDAALLNNCGHAFDGPAFLLKQAENNWLDFALYISSNSKSSIGREIYSRYVLLGQLDNTHFAKEKVEEILQKISKNVSRKGINYKLSILNRMKSMLSPLLVAISISLPDYWTLWIPMTNWPSSLVMRLPMRTDCTPSVK